MSAHKSGIGSAEVVAAISFLTLHRDRSRHDFFARRPWPAPFFDKTIDSWVVVDPSDCEAILRMPGLRPGTADIANAHKAIESRYGYTFDTLNAIFPHIPLCAHGAEHREVRRRMATVLAERRGAVLGELDRIIKEAIAVLKPGTQIELMGTLVTPLVRSVLCSVVGVRFGDESSFQLVSVIFDRLIGFRKRQTLDGALHALRLKMREAPLWEKTEEEESAYLALFVLGNDTLGGSFGESLYQLLRQNPGKRLSEISYPEIPNESGVPYVERISESAFEYEGNRFEGGERIRVYLHSFAYSGEGDPARIFGVGPHTCLGKPLSLDIWRKLTTRLAEVPLYADVVDFETRTEDYLFNVPSRIVVNVWE